MKKVKRLAAVAISVILLTLNASTMTYGFQNDGKISRDATPANPEKQTVLYADDYVTMYSPDGQTVDIPKSKVDYYKNQGWSENKSDIYTTMCSSPYFYSSKKVAVLNSHVGSYLKAGWVPYYYVTMYSPDGKTADIYKSEVSSYKNQGWSENKSDIYTTMYSSRDLSTAREIDVLNSRVEDYLSAGWVPKSELFTTLYSYDGRTLEVANVSVETYRAVGWQYRNEVYTTLYTEDGRKAEFLNSDVAKQKAVGWYEWSELQRTLYSEDGRSIQVHKNEVDAYKKVGWYEWNELYITMYSEDGRKINVRKNEIEAYKKVGWYEWNELYVTMYSADGRTTSVRKNEVEAYKKVGWYSTASEAQKAANTANNSKKSGIFGHWETHHWVEAGAVIISSEPLTGKVVYKSKCPYCGKVNNSEIYTIRLQMGKSNNNAMCSNPKCSNYGKTFRVVINCKTEYVYD